MATGINCWGLAVDPSAGKIYFSQIDGGKILSANSDGSETQAIVDGLTEPFGLTLDPAAGKIYFTDRRGHTIHRANVDGSEQELLFDLSGGTDDAWPNYLAVDSEGGYVYWTDQHTGKVQRGPLDGAGPIEDLVTTDTQKPRGIALDPAAGHLYFSDFGNGTIKRANLDGSDVVTLVDSGLGTSADIELDLTHGHIYHLSREGTVSRFSLEGGNPEIVHDAAGADWHNLVLVVPEPATTTLGLAAAASLLASGLARTRHPQHRTHGG
jgi:sugar lactone lactonase YvrE